MTQKDFLSDDLFIYWRLNPSRELDAYWNRFILENKHLQTAFEKAIETFDEMRKEKHQFHYEETIVKKKLDKQIASYRGNKIRRIYYATSVAAIGVLLVISLFFIPDTSEVRSIRQNTIGEVMNKDSVILLTGEQVVNIAGNANLQLSDNEESALIQSASGREKIKLSKKKLNKLIVPFGKRTEMTLSDDSKVYLNSGTQIEFPSLFNANKREISVRGEIFIEVSKGKKPFVINTPQSQIQVYGTSFNVSAYDEEQTESVALVSGSVKVASNNHTLMLKPNQLAQIKDGLIQSKAVDVSEYISWKNGFIQFNKMPLNEVLKKIGRYYNVKFVYLSDLNLDSKTCTGKLFLAADLDDVLASFSNMTSLKYQKHDNNIIHILNQ